MQISLNGQPYVIEGQPTVAELLEVLDIKSRRVAVMVNEAIVKKAVFGEARLNEGDSVEVIQMVGGGR